MAGLFYFICFAYPCIEATRFASKPLSFTAMSGSAMHLGPTAIKETNKKRKNLFEYIIFIPVNQGTIVKNFTPIWMEGR